MASLTANYTRLIFYDFNNLLVGLETLGFTIDENDQMRWGLAPQDSNCYWSIDRENSKMNFVNSEGTEVFTKPIVDMSGSCITGVIFMDLAEGGCMLYLTPLQENSSEEIIQNFTYSCTNTTADTQVNGLVVCTPAETDGKWRYHWRDKGTAFKWDTDDTVRYISIGSEVPDKLMIPEPGLVTLVRAYLNSGNWSQHIFVEVLGETEVPSSVFRLNGQKYITFTDNTTSRAPTFKLPVESQSRNVRTSTEEYSINKTYAVGDYCIYNGKLWRCTVAVTVPTPFDTAYWVETTVYIEKTR